MPPVDAAVFVRQLNSLAGTRFELGGAAALGANGGAAFVRWPDGRAAVAKRSRASLAAVRRTADVLTRLRARGVPVPTYQLVSELPQGVAIVQDRLPGAPTTTMDRAMVQAIVAANEHFVDLLDDDANVPTPPMNLTTSGCGHCLHETLVTYSRRSRQILQTIRAIGKAAPIQLPGNDLVHLDFTGGNFLFDDTRALTGIVDWDNIGRGDRRFALVQLRFSLGWAHVLADGHSHNLAVEPDAITWLDEHLRSILDATTLRIYWAHWSLHMIDWTIRHGGQRSVDFHLDLAAHYLTRA